MLRGKRARQDAERGLYIAALRQQGSAYTFAIREVSREKPLISGLNVDFNAALSAVYGLLSALRSQQHAKPCPDRASPSALDKLAVIAGVVALAVLAWMTLR